MDRSRSSRHHQSFASFSKNKSELKLPTIDDKNKVSVQQKEGKSNKSSPKKGKNQKKSPASANKSKKNTQKSKSPATTQKKTTGKKK